MTIKECIKNKGIQVKVSSLKRWQSVNIQFFRPNGNEDETQLDVNRIGTEAGKDELQELYNTFCKENGFNNDTVQNIIIVDSAFDYEDLK